MCFFLAETPIEEFTPTPAFPALQYLESVDVDGVACRAGLRTGDFLIEVIKDSTTYFITEHTADGTNKKTNNCRLVYPPTVHLWT